MRHIPLRASTRGWNLRSRPPSGARAVADPAPRAPDGAAHAQPEARAVRPGRRSPRRRADRRQHRPRAVRDARRPAGLRRALVYSLEAFASRWSDVELVQNTEDVELMRRRRLVGALASCATSATASTSTASDPDRSRRRACGAAGGVGQSTTAPSSSARSVGSSPRRATSSCSRRSPSSAPGVRLVVVGGARPGQARCALDRLVAAASGSDGVVLLGHRDDVDAARRLRRVRARLAPRGPAACRDGGGGVRAAGRGHRRPRLPPGRRRRVDGHARGCR